MNKVFLVMKGADVWGLECECGNSEAVPDKEGVYVAFSYWRSEGLGGAFEACCKICNSPVSRVTVKKV